MTAPLLGSLAAAFSILLIWPQVWLSCIHRRTSGLSATACWLGVALSSCWLTYGLLVQDIVQIANNLVVGAAQTAVLIALLITQPALRTRRALAATAWGAGALVLVAATALAAAALPTIRGAAVGATLGVITSVAGMIAGLPQPISLLRDRSQDLSGLSAARWGLTVVSGALWAGYGLAVGQPAVWASGGFGLGCALLVCAMIALDRRNASVAAVTPLPAAPEMQYTKPSVALVA
jgi:uncharacterized protein with PQ loop repeat